MARDIEVEPLVTREVCLSATEVRHGAQEYSAGAQQSSHSSNCALRIGHMLEHVPHHHRIEAAVLDHQITYVSDRDRKPQRIPRVRSGLLGEFGAKHLPAALAEFPQQKSRAAADVQNSAFAAEHSLNGRGAPPIQRSL